MTDNNPRPPPDTPDSDDFCNQWPFELSEYLQLDDFESFSPENNVSNQVHLSGSGGSGSYFEGSSNSKYINICCSFSLKSLSSTEKLLDKDFKTLKQCCNHSLYQHIKI